MNEVWMHWSYRALFTQTAGGGGEIQVNISSSERWVVLYGILGPDNRGAGRNQLVQIINSDDDVLSKVMFTTSADNITTVFPKAKASAIADGEGQEFNSQIIIGSGNVLKFIAAGILDTETLTISIEGLIRTTLPTVTITGSGGTVTTTTDYSKVI